MSQLTNEQKAILDTIAYYEGTIGRSQNGYDLLFGAKKIMKGWTPDTTTIKHGCINPHGSISASDINNAGEEVCADKTWETSYQKNGETKTSTAAGRYQFLGWAWFEKTKDIGLEYNAPMSKENQDRIANWSVKKF